MKKIFLNKSKKKKNKFINFTIIKNIKINKLSQIRD